MKPNMKIFDGMKKYIILLAWALISMGCTKAENGNGDKGGNGTPAFELPAKAIVLAEQSVPAVMIMNAETNVVVWQWNPVDAGLTEEEQEWFVNPSEVKPVYDGTCLLMTASGGAVALIRVEDRKLLFYGKCGVFPNPHSAEILPDGNIVTAESRYGEICIFVRTEDALTSEPKSVANLADAHNAVWSEEHNCLFMTGKAADGKVSLYKFEYNGKHDNPELINQKEVYHFTNETGGHDLYPVYGEKNRLWLSAANGVYKVDVSKPETPVCEKLYSLLSIKSVSSSPDGIVMLKPTESWWAEGLINEKGERLFILPGMKFYKGRWWL